MGQWTIRVGELQRDVMRLVSELENRVVELENKVAGMKEGTVNWRDA